MFTVAQLVLREESGKNRKILHKSAKISDQLRAKKAIERPLKIMKVM